ncbi:MAG: hypothetical protein IJ677_08495 [Alphaproteobacteria bacterium]|nr:hypothetical protein [Alphaproteobacteria bacterium]
MKKVMFVLSILICLNIRQVMASDSYIVNGENYSYNFNIYNTEESLQLDDETFQSPFLLDKNYIAPLISSAKSWAEIIKTQYYTQQPVIYAVFTLNDYNASAVSPYVDIAESPYKVTYTNAKINNKTVIGPEEILGINTEAFINIGLGVDKNNPGWNAYHKIGALYAGELSDLHAVLLHEEMHSLGISSAVSPYKEDEGDKTNYFSENDRDSLTIFDKNLRVYTGDDNFDFAKEIIPQAGMSVGKNEEFDIFKYSPYFVGENTIKVLGGKDDYNDARIAIINNGGLTNYSVSYENMSDYPQVFGMPIHNADDDDVDLSHLELHNSFMSHQSYRNWLIPMEAELAVMQDIGYNIDLRKYFGKSYYLDDITDTYTSGYSEYSGGVYTGNLSQVTQGVGIHIYGNDNKITQASDILSSGEGSIGVRVDGVDNTYILKNGYKISTNGDGSLGLAVTWGNGHNISVEKDAVISATGEDGISASFNFGANLFGSSNNVIGSYINYDSYYRISVTPNQDTTAPLVNEFSVSGTLEGKQAAIYISDNAHVEEINILQGAQIKGDIISDWNSLQSGKNAKVMVEQDGKWYIVSPTMEELLYFTDLNISQYFSGEINGNINGENGIYNTLKLNNKGNLSFGGKKIAVNSFKNDGNINSDNLAVDVQKGQITGNGNLNIGKKLVLGKNINQIDNTINLAENAVLSTINDNVQDITVHKLNTDNAKLYFDLGDTYTLQIASDTNTAQIAQIKASEIMAEQLSDGTGVVLFGDADRVLDLGNSSANIYYDGNKYTLSQYDGNKSMLYVSLSAEGIDLSDAISDESTANYIVKEEKENNDLGEIKGDYFEISGNNIDVGGHKGLIVNGNENKSTVLKTGISNASDTDISVYENGKLEVIAEDGDIAIGQNDENAIYLNNAEVILNAGDNEISIAGSIKGNNAEKDMITAGGNSVNFAETDNVQIIAQAEEVNMADKSLNTIWNTSSQAFNVAEDKYLSGGNNQLIADGGKINLANDSANDIVLDKIVLNKYIQADVDVDLKTLSADRFVLAQSDDLINNNGLLEIDEVNLMNENTPLTDEEYFIPFVSESLHNENMLGYVKLDGQVGIVTPVFKYDFGYKQEDMQSGFALTRGSSKKYDSFNPAVMVAPVAAQTGGYISQLNSYNEAFYGTDTAMMSVENAKGSLADYNRKDKKIWIRPHSSFENVDLRRGPKVRNNMYDFYFGGDSELQALDNNWKYQDSIYGGYNTSRQKYDGNSIHQYGFTFGLARTWYKNNFFTAATANMGADQAKARTMYGKEDFYMFRAGLASKTGYNWNLKDGKMVIQPNYLMSYTFINTFNYTNAADVRIKQDPLHAVNIAPGVKAIYKFDNGWKPYIEAQMVWNVFDKTDFKAQNTELAEMSVKPYCQYGFGLQKSWYNNLSAYGQTMFRSGGRSGVDISAGIQWNF